ncbi:TraB/GumN family protein [Parvularcula lutaonensis]|uniref:TraB/GumN family protein n=1 Tax=Parvularcula lutaonensis TaxID=491923 RepID=A0ABV7MAB3_9PROT|nr:TraB/GumN family protein [Parvularcula lutaonensis]GGY36519.1 hypothetical protein GCM10007148_00870 [Parvularcula lutaonensis]
MRFLNKALGISVLALMAACGQQAEEAAEADSTGTMVADTMSAGAPFWVVSDEDSKMVLFPTIHVLPEDLEWKSEAYEAALAEADEVWFEILPTEMNDQAQMQQLALQYGMSPDKPLSERLSPELYAELEAAATEVGLPMQALEPMRPWFAAVNLSVMDLMGDGFTPGAGVETVVAAETPDEKERGLETVAQQLGFFGSLPEDVEIMFLEATLEQMESGQKELKEFAEDWASGDVSGLEEFVIGGIRDVSEELYQVLLVKRNQDWVEQLAEELEGSGNDFVAVGAGHLVGADGVPQLLAARGYKVEGPGF